MIQDAYIHHYGPVWYHEGELGLWLGCMETILTLR